MSVYERVVKAALTGGDQQVIEAVNPLPADIDWQRVEDILGIRILQSPLQREVVLSTAVGESESDLLGAERQEVDRAGELSDGWVRVVLQWHGELSGALALLDALNDQGAAGRQLHVSLQSSVVPASPLDPATSAPAATDAAPEGTARQSGHSAAAPYIPFDVAQDVADAIDRATAAAGRARP